MRGNYKSREVAGGACAMSAAGARGGGGKRGRGNAGPRVVRAPGRADLRARGSQGKGKEGRGWCSPGPFCPRVRQRAGRMAGLPWLGMPASGGASCPEWFISLRTRAGYPALGFFRHLDPCKKFVWLRALGGHWCWPNSFTDRKKRWLRVTALFPTNSIPSADLGMKLELGTEAC